MSDVIILDHLKESTEEQFKKFIIGECRRMDRLDVYEWVADDELKIKQLQQENNQLKDKINTYENPEDLALMFMYCDEKAKDKLKGVQEERDYLFNKQSIENKYLALENKQLKDVIEEVKTEISSLMSKYFYEKDFCIEDIHLDKLLQILDKATKEGVYNGRKSN